MDAVCAKEEDKRETACEIPAVAADKNERIRQQCECACSRERLLVKKECL